MSGELVDMPKRLPSSFGEAVDIRQLLSVARRRLPIAVVVGLLIFIGVAALTLRQTPVYMATANVLLDTRQRDVVRVQSVTPNLSPDTNTVDTEVEVLRSRTLAEAVMTALGLDRDPEFNPALDKPGPVLSFIRSVLPATRPAAPPPGDARARQAIVDRILSKLKVSRSGLTYMINVSYQSYSPAKAAEIANSFADIYLAQQLGAKSGATEDASQWLGSRLAQLRGDVQTAEAAVQQYKIANNLLSSQGATLTEQQISSLDQQLASTRAEQAEREARLNTARAQLAKGSTGDDVGEALGSTVVQDLRRQRTEVSRKVAELEVRYNDRYPALIEKRRELADIDNQIKQEIARVISNLEAQAQVARERTRSIAGSVSEAKGALESNNRADVRLRELERNAEAVRSVYETFLTRYRETSAQTGLAQSDARIASRAKTPTGPSSPNIKLSLLLGLLLGGACGIASITLAEALDNGLSTAADVEKTLGVRAIGSIPLLASTVSRKDRRMSPETFVLKRPLSSFAESFRTVQALVMGSSDGAPVQVIGITSSLPGEGKTTTSICMARQLAVAGYRTLLVDCDARHRSLSKMLRLGGDVGLVEVLTAGASLDHAIEQDEASGIDVLPMSTAPDAPSNVFMSDAIDRLLATLRAQYDVIVLDTPPVLPVADTAALAPKTDSIIFLTRWRRTPVKAVETALTLLARVKAPLTGVVLTQVDMRVQTREGYGDAGYYYKSYRGYYVN